jgi:transposase InsO family protein
MAQELGNARAACRAMGIHPSTYYRWKRQLDRYGPEILRPRERRPPRMANQTSVLVEQRVVAFALGHPGFGPARIAAELARPKWGGIRLSTNGVWRVLRRHGLSTRAKRYGLVAGYAAPPEPQRPTPAPERHLDVDHPGQLVQLDCFCIGRLSGTKGTVWQYTAIDVASAYTWATLQVTRRNPSATWTSQLAHTVAADLAARGWKLERVMSDNAQEFRAATFQTTIATLGASHRFIRAGRPQTNGCVERVQQTILEECWKPAFARYLIPKQTGLRLDLERYLRYYNTERAHTGRWTKGRTPEQVLGKAKLWQNKR